jgi:hypothetical protein
MVKNSEPFNIEIFKDAELTQMIIQMSDGVVVPSSKITPGALQNLTMTANPKKVQSSTIL